MPPDIKVGDMARILKRPGRAYRVDATTAEYVVLHDQGVFERSEVELAIITEETCPSPEK